MNKIDIATQSMAVAPEVIKEIRDTAWEGTIAVERISGLAFAICVALDSVSNEAISRSVVATAPDTVAEPITTMREWAVIASLMDLLKDQAETCGNLFERAEVAAGKATRADRIAVVAGQNGAGGAR
jgi:hypothetical protein